MADESVPAPAATVVLVRSGARGLEVYLVRRRPGPGFMAGTWVFPGGVVDPADRRPSPWGARTDLAPAELEDRLGGDLPSADALGYAVAAVRETFEEAGAFLGRAGGRAGLERLRRLRRAGPLPRGWLAEATGAPGGRLALSRLRRWARWVTPDGMARRFDTRFFLAGADADDLCSPDGREVVDGGWFGPREALEQNQAGALPLSPPTLVTLHGLLGREDAGGVLQEARHRPWGEAIRPRLVRAAGGAVLLEPWDPRHGSADPGVAAGDLGRLVLPVGEPFSRLWHDGRCWRPVAAPVGRSGPTGGQGRRPSAPTVNENPPSGANATRSRTVRSVVDR